MTKWVMFDVAAGDLNQGLTTKERIRAVRAGDVSKVGVRPAHQFKVVVETTHDAETVATRCALHRLGVSTVEEAPHPFGIVQCAEEVIVESSRGRSAFALEPSHKAACSYCTSPAAGLGEDAEFTCGDSTCVPVVKSMPKVVEVSLEGGSERE